MGTVGGSEWIIIIIAVLILFFGAKKIPELARAVGEGMTEFKKATNKQVEEGKNEDEVNNHSEATSDTQNTHTKAKTE
ncbi:MAG TPA: twin-arginine translocase TatA/TatE family subunit [Balneolaceae bacterium]|nr:twin-arginine translocase TatA/TatE family subunit [Balneolaceae bacterium]